MLKQHERWKTPACVHSHSRGDGALVAGGGRGKGLEDGEELILRVSRHIRNKLAKYLYILQYYFYHKVLFGVTNTKFDISYCVFRESFIDDQYEIRNFLSKIGSSNDIFFLDIGRNHGFVFYYMMYYIMKNNFRVSSIRYYGIDPSPLKFVYFNFRDYLSKCGIKIDYNIIDRAVVFHDEQTVTLKYGENNFGNFNVSGSSYERKLQGVQSRYEYIEITVETIQLSEIKKLIKDNIDSDAIIVKIDCKNKTDYIFMEILDMMYECKSNYLVSCERDGSSGRDVSAYVRKNSNVLNASNK